METIIPPSQSEAMQVALLSLQRVAPTDLTVIIQGERGTGKEWAAHLVHQMSSRAQAPFHAVDCGAVGAEHIEREIFGYDAISWESIEIRRGAFEEAAGGTLFLHNIHLVPPPVQLRTARAVEYKQFRRIGGDKTHELNVRIIATASTSPDPLRESHGTTDEFGSRLTAITVTIPPLRERKSDIPVLIDRFLRELRDRYANPVHGITKDAIDRCSEYDWPGNVRQLKNAMEYAAIMSAGGLIQPEHLPSSLQNDRSTQREFAKQTHANKKKG